MLYLYEAIQKSSELNGITRVRTASGDTHEGKFIYPIGEGMVEFKLLKGGTVFILFNMIESVTLLTNLELLEEASAKADEHDPL